MAISNNGQLTALYNRKQSGSGYVKQPSDVGFRYKKLKSKPYITANQIGNVEWRFHDTEGFSVRKPKLFNAWLCYDKKPKQKMSDCLKQQYALYRKLKREYEREQATPKAHVVDDTITRADKLQAVTRKKTVQMLSGLACSPRYDRIYNACF